MNIKLTRDVSEEKDNYLALTLVRQNHYYRQWLRGWCSEHSLSFPCLAPGPHFFITASTLPLKTPQSCPPCSLEGLWIGRRWLKLGQSHLPRNLKLKQCTTEWKRADKSPWWKTADKSFWQLFQDSFCSVLPLKYLVLGLAVQCFLFDSVSDPICVQQFLVCLSA